MQKPRLLFYFLHLLGVGHVYRAKRLIEGFAHEGIEVDVIYGGKKIDVDFEAASVFHLPPISVKDASYKQYLDANGEQLTDAFMASRQSTLLDHIAKLSPDAVLIEAWPFGRRIVGNEIRAMLDDFKSRRSPPLTVTSVRDILQPRKLKRDEETIAMMSEYVDHIMVHSDPSLIALDATFPMANAIRSKLAYTGFVTPTIDLTRPAKQFDALVTCGGGGFGFEMLKTALACTQNFPQLKSWCLATGPHMREAEVSHLKQNTPDNVTVVTRLENLAAHMNKAKISISQCGYNTAMDALVAGTASECRPVFVPYDTSGQMEQSRRAELLQEAGLAQNIPQSMLTPKTLNDAITAAFASPKQESNIDFNGVQNSAQLMRQWMGQKS